MKNQYDNLEKAEAYDHSLKIWEDGEYRAENMKLTPGMRVLDIGSGPGILSIPLAKRGCIVTAVEPSAAMRRLLQQHIDENHLEQIRILPYTWEETPDDELEQYDLILMSYSLMMEDFQEAVHKICRHGRGAVEMYWFAGETSWERDRRILAERMGRKLPILPHRKIDFFYQELYQMGIYSDLTMLSGTAFDREYHCFEDGVANMQKRYEVTQEDLPVLENFLKERLENKGGLWHYQDLTNYAKLSWNVPDRA